MAATISLDYLGNGAGIGDSTSIEVGYWIDGADNETDATHQLATFAPLRLGGLVITNVKADAEENDSGLFYGRVTYGTRQLDQSTYSFEIGVASTKITQSLETVGGYALPGKSPSNFGGAINVTRDGVEGTEISVPNFQWNETHYLPKSMMTSFYFALLYNTVATMNADTFRGFDYGQVLLIGVNGSLSQNVPSWEMQFKFLALPNSTGGSVGPITIGPKLGHDYLWVRYKDFTDATSISTVKLPYEVFIERVYTFSAYDNLRLPDPF